MTEHWLSTPGDECGEAAGVWEGWEEVSEQPMQTADGLLALATAWPPKAAAGQGTPCLATGHPICTAPQPQPCPACRFVPGNVLSEGRSSLSLGRALQEAGAGCGVAVPSLGTRAPPPLQPCSAEARLRQLLLRAAAVGQFPPAEVGLVSLPVLLWLCASA